jgi:two-component system, OmpR family, response regulator
MSVAEVKLVRWPAEAASLARYRRMNVLRLLVIEGMAEPPITADVKEDWVRPPVSKADLLARIAALRARSDVHAGPHVDPVGLLRYGSRSVTLSAIGTALLTRLADDFGVLVPREELLDLLPGNDGDRNALDLQIMRLRRRIEPLGLGIRTVRGRGYVLMPQDGA